MKPNDLAIEMFQKFARFEYALKVSGFHKPSLNNAVIKAEPDWVRFGCSIAGKLENPRNSSLSEATDYIRRHPPQYQVVKTDGSLGWKATNKTAPCIDAEILLHVCQVRNNLFHGGKLDRDRNWFPEHAERSELLIKHSLTTLNGCLEACEKVKIAYSL